MPTVGKAAEPSEVSCLWIKPGTRAVHTCVGWHYFAGTGFFIFL